jgi:serine/threonine protein kinase
MLTPEHGKYTGSHTNAGIKQSHAVEAEGEVAKAAVSRQAAAAAAAPAATAAAAAAAGATATAAARKRKRRAASAVAVADRLEPDCWDLQKILRKSIFGEVQVVAHRRSGESRAVKVINKQAILKPREILRGFGRASEETLRREAEILSGLDHEGIVRLERWFETESHLYLVMEFLPGGDLLACIQQHGHFTETEARRLFKELCEAVTYLHTRDIVHRDLKLENILLTAEERSQAHLKITDFGISRRAQRSRECRTFCGSLDYTAPEVIRLRRCAATAVAGAKKMVQECEPSQDKAGGEVGPSPSGEELSGYGKPADMWSLGVVLYIMLSGGPPFDGEHEEYLCVQIAKGDWAFDDKAVWDSVSPAAKDLVLELLALDPRKRPTIQQASAHRWLQGSSSSPSTCPAQATVAAPKSAAAVEPGLAGDGRASSPSTLQDRQGPKAELHVLSPSLPRSRIVSLHDSDPIGTAASRDREAYARARDRAEHWVRGRVTGFHGEDIDRALGGPSRPLG